VMKGGVVYKAKGGPVVHQAVAAGGGA